jgi:hypothetical protein
MESNEIHKFADRDWNRLSEMDRAYWSAEYRRNGFIATLKASQTLWLHMKSIRPEWPDDAERRQDLDHHIAQSKLFGRIANDIPPHSAAA